MSGPMMASRACDDQDLRKSSSTGKGSSRCIRTEICALWPVEASRYKSGRTRARPGSDRWSPAHLVPVRLRAVLVPRRRWRPLRRESSPGFEAELHADNRPDRNAHSANAGLAAHNLGVNRDSVRGHWLLVTPAVEIVTAIHWDIPESCWLRPSSGVPCRRRNPSWRCGW